MSSQSRPKQFWPKPRQLAAWGISPRSSHDHRSHPIFPDASRRDPEKIFLRNRAKSGIDQTSIPRHRKFRAPNRLPETFPDINPTIEVKEVGAAEAYLSLANYRVVNQVGVVPFIVFKNWATGGVGGIFKKMFHHIQFEREEFLQHYHRRSNIESTVMMMIKTKFGDAVRSKTEVAARNKVLAKILCHNLCCLISAMYELGIEPKFSQFT
jgi:hypothetical protein